MLNKDFKTSTDSFKLINFPYSSSIHMYHYNENNMKVNSKASSLSFSLYLYTEERNDQFARRGDAE